MIGHLLSTNNNQFERIVFLESFNLSHTVWLILDTNCTIKILEITYRLWVIEYDFDLAFWCSFICEFYSKMFFRLIYEIIKIYYLRQKVKLSTWLQEWIYDKGVKMKMKDWFKGDDHLNRSSIGWINRSLKPWAISLPFFFFLFQNNKN